MGAARDFVIPLDFAALECLKHKQLGHNFSYARRVQLFVRIVLIEYLAG